MALEGLHPGVDEIGIALETNDPTKDTSSDIKNRWSEKPNQNRVIKPALFEEDDNDHTTYLELAKYSELLGVTDQEGDIIIYNYQSSDYDNSDNMYIEKYFDDQQQGKNDSNFLYKDADESSTSKVVNNVTPPVVNSVSENVTPSVTNDSGEGKKLYQTKPSGGKLYKSENMETCISIQSLDGSTTYHNSSNDFIIHKVSDTFGDGVRRDELPESELKKFRTNDVIEEDLEEKEELRQKAKNTNKVITHVPKNLNYSYIEDNLAGGDVFYSDLSLPQMADISDI